MIDNLVHIAHNVKIGSNCIIAAMTGISGSTEIGDNVMIGGQVGISGHLKIGDNVKIISGFNKNKTGEVIKIFLSSCVEFATHLTSSGNCDFVEKSNFFSLLNLVESLQRERPHFLSRI